MRLIHTARFEKDYSATPTDVRLLSAAIAPVGQLHATTDCDAVSGITLCVSVASTS